jgi:glycerol dehydrogenase-like iron-containing ADH family enzyme
MAAAGFPTAVARGLVESVSADLPPYAAFVAVEPYELVENRLARRPDHVVVAGAMEQAALDETAARVAESGIEAVVGIGGGSAIDTAKYVAWKSGLPLWQLPSIASVDAAFTQPVGVRVGGRVRYLGSAVPQLVAFDLDLVLAAPERLNRAGAGDILSCHTGLADWRLAAAQGRAVPIDDTLVARAEGWLAGLDEHATVVAAAGEEGVRYLISTLGEIGTACDEAGFSYFEEGSEHYFAYCLEYLTGLRIVHGELVALGILAMSIAQDNDPAGVEHLLERLGLRYRPAELGIDAAAFRRVLAELPAFCASEEFPPSAAGSLDGDGRAAIERWPSLRAG